MSHKTTHRTRWGSETIEIRADWANSASLVEGTADKQVAEFRHDPRRAMRSAVELAAIAEGCYLARCRDLIDLAVARMVEVEQ